MHLGMGLYIGIVQTVKLLAIDWMTKIYILGKNRNFSHLMQVALGPI